MLSPGEWYKKIPTKPAQNMVFRKNLLARCAGDPGFRREVDHICSQDLLFYTNAFIFQHNPNARIGEEFGPFVTWSFQEEAFFSILSAIEDRKDLAIEKSRELGASWMVLIAFHWLWKYFPNLSFLCLSRNEDAVDKAGASSSLFWKIDYILKHLPAWMIPDVERRDGFIGNASNNSAIVGEASTESSGVGGRFTAMLIDEFAKFKVGNKDVQVYQSTADTSYCRIFVSTHYYGTGTQFHQICTNGYTRKVVMHWSQHPEKGRGKYYYDQKRDAIVLLDPGEKACPAYSYVREFKPAGGPYPGVRSPWYDDQCERRGNPRFIAQHLDIDATGSVDTFFGAGEISRYTELWCRPCVWEGEIRYDRDTARPDGLVAQEKGSLRLWIHPDHNSVVTPGAYVLAADVATGNGSSNSVISIVNAEKGEKVGEYATCTTPPELLALILMSLGWVFKDRDGSPGKICWEESGPGLTVGTKTQEFHYPNMYYRSSLMEGRAGTQSKTPGWVPNADNKRRLLDSYAAAIRLGEFINPSKEAIDECLDYRYEGISIEHKEEKNKYDPTGARVNHGDRVIADALAWMLVKDLNLMGERKVVKREEKPVGSLAWRRELHAQSDSLDENGWGRDEP